MSASTLCRALSGNSKPPPQPVITKYQTPRSTSGSVHLALGEKLIRPPARAGGSPCTYTQHPWGSFLGVASRLLRGVLDACRVYGSSTLPLLQALIWFKKSNESNKRRKGRRQRQFSAHPGQGCTIATDVSQIFQGDLYCSATRQPQSLRLFGPSYACTSLPVGGAEENRTSKTLALDVAAHERCLWVTQRPDPTLRSLDFSIINTPLWERRFREERSKEWSKREKRHTLTHTHNDSNLP